MRNRRFSALLVIATCLAAIFGSEQATHTQSAPSYGVTDLGTIGGTTTVALAIDQGALPDIYGYGSTASGDTHALLSRPGFLTTDLGTLGGRRSEARRSTQFSGAVGWSELADGSTHAAYFLSAPPQDLGTLGGTRSFANGVARQQQGLVIVGGSTLAGDAVTHAFIYQGSTMSDLGATLGGPNSVANDINTPGHVVGSAELPGGAVHHGFLWNGGVTTDLGSFGGDSEALAVNDSDTVVGRSDLANGVQHAFRYIGGVMQDLGTLGGSSSEASDLNAAGVVVGWAETAQGARHAFVWRDGVMTDLNSLVPAGTGWELQAATGIADLGGIVGFGRFQGQTRAFLLTPAKDVRLTLSALGSDVDTNYPKPVETGKSVVFGATVFNPGPYTLTGITVTHTFTGPVEIDPSWTWGVQSCTASGLQVTCRMPAIDVAMGFKSMLVYVRTTAAGVITHSASVVTDTPDTDSSNNTTGTETNTAVSLASFTLNPVTVIGGQESPLGHVDLTSAAPGGDAVVTLTSSNPQIASVPSQFGVHAGDTWREFYVTTGAVSANTTVQISATYGLVTKVIPLTIAAAGVSTPYQGTPLPLPGVIQGEDFDVGGEGVSYHDTDRGNEGGAYRQTDVDIEMSGDGGADVGWIAAGEWLAYTVNISKAGAYTLEARVAAPSAGGTFHVEIDGTRATDALTIPNTGGWQSWATVSAPITLPAGTHVLRVSFDAFGAGGVLGNLDYLRVTAASDTASAPFGGTPWPIPGTIQAEDFDEGGDGIAYHDISAGNSGGQYRSTNVDIEATTDQDGGYDVGWIEPGDWLAYTANVTRAGSYVLDARVAAAGAGGTFHVDVDGANVTGPLSIPNTGGWQVWTTVSATVTLPVGIHVVRVTFDQLGAGGVMGNLNYLSFTSSDGPTSTPFGGTPRAIPGTIQAEDFDDGGEGVAYHDTTAGNTGGWYRATDVDIEPSSDAGGGYNVGWIAAGEYLGYTVNVALPGAYLLEARVASLGPGGSFHIELNRSVYGGLSIPDTGGWQNWTTVTRNVTLSPGSYVMRVVFDSPGAGGAVGNLDWVRFTAVNPQTPYFGTPATVPGVVEAEYFDYGGEGVAYHDTTAGNSGGWLRTSEDVDIERATDPTSAGADVGWMTAGEWMNYTLNVARAGTYTVRARVAANGTGGTFHLEFGGGARTETEFIPNTGGWQMWTDVYLTVTLNAGTQVMRFVADANGPTGVFGNLNYVQVLAQ